MRLYSEIEKKSDSDILQSLLPEEKSLLRTIEDNKAVLLLMLVLAVSVIVI